MSETELKRDIHELRDEVKANTKVTLEGFETMNGRVKTLELSEARRQGRESVSNGSDLDWKKLALQLVGILATGAAIGLAIARAVLK